MEIHEFPLLLLRFPGRPKLISSARRHTGSAARASSTECCFINTVDTHTRRQKSVTDILLPVFGAELFSQVEAIPSE